MRIASKIKKIRKDNNLTQDDLADILNVSRSTIALYEKGLRKPDINTIHIISEYFNIPLDEMYKDYIDNKKINKNKIKKLISLAITLVILIIFVLVTNFINVINRYGYNIYNDELKVKNSNYICIVKIDKFENHINNAEVYKVIETDILKSTDYEKYRIERLFIINDLIKIDIVSYIIFANLNFKVNNEIKYAGLTLTITDKPFIVELKDYDESLPYNEQTGKCKTTIDYYLNIINSQ